ncbi:DUF1523 family protein [Erythrobacter phage vB_EliS-L02]|nr:DUF1523 family protein [Erythrobacter phage vB_EliS-L02]
MAYAGLAFIALLIALYPIYLVAYWGTEREYSFVVSKTDRECDANGESTVCRNFVYGTGGEVFTNSDDLFYGKFDSRTVQAGIEQGTKTTVRAVGWRIPFLSMQPNIIEVVSSQPVEVAESYRDMGQ